MYFVCARAIHRSPSMEDVTVLTNFVAVSVWVQEFPVCSATCALLAGAFVFLKQSRYPAVGVFNVVV